MKLQKIPGEINKNEVSVEPYATEPEKFTLHQEFLIKFVFV